MNIIIIGPPGSGKGTQAKLLSQAKEMIHISTGDLLRSAREERKDIAKVLERGELVSDEIVVEILENYLTKINTFDNIVFDGSPRSLVQYEEMKKTLKKRGGKIGLAINLVVSDKEVIRRLSARRIDKKTGQIYNLITNPPGTDVNKKDLVQRNDDKPRAIKERLRLQKPPTNMVLAFKKDGIYKEVDGELSIEEIQRELLKLVI